MEHVFDIDVKYGYRHGPYDVLAAVANGEDVSPEHYDMHTPSRLETGDERYDRVNRTLFVGTGGRLKDSVLMSVFAIK